MSLIKSGDSLNFFFYSIVDDDDDDVESARSKNFNVSSCNEPFIESLRKKLLIFNAN